MRWDPDPFLLEIRIWISNPGFTDNTAAKHTHTPYLGEGTLGEKGVTPPPLTYILFYSTSTLLISLNCGIKIRGKLGFFFIKEAECAMCEISL